MGLIEDNINYLLAGRAMKEQEEYCDFTLEEQNEAYIAQGSKTVVPTDFKAILKENVCYIVAAVLIDSNGSVLMIQEAKSSCSGQWYLPAGRMEPGENIVDAAKREVLEETGLEIVVTTLLMVESASGSWYRFVVTGQVTGGELKTLAKADSESLQARWVSNLKELCLRGEDIYPLIHRAKQFISQRVEPWHPLVIPVEISHSKLLIRLVICIRKKANNRISVLVSDKVGTHIPVIEVNPVRSLSSTLQKYMVEIFGSDLPPHRPQGVLSVELQTNIPKGNQDGFCLTVLVPIRKALEEVPLIDKYSWIEVAKTTQEDLLSRLSKNMIIPLNVIRSYESDA